MNLKGEAKLKEVGAEFTSWSASRTPRKARRACTSIEVGASGEGRLEITTATGNLKPNDPMSFLDRAIVIHEGADKGAQASGARASPSLARRSRRTDPLAIPGGELWEVNGWAYPALDLGYSDQAN